MARDFYFFNDGTIKRHDNTIRFILKESGKKDLPVENIDNIYIFSEIQLNTTGLNYLSKYGIVVHFFNYYGFYTGTFYPVEKKVSGDLLLKQVRAYDDSKKRLRIAQEFIIGASENIYRNLRYYKNRGKETSEEMEKIRILIDKIKMTTDIEMLMGIEGNIHRVYYKTFTKIINQDIDFKKRVKRPPDNVINTLISFLNTMMYTQVLSEIYKTQLNPTISYLHTPSTKRFSLCLDIAEVFKPILVDRLIFSLLNKNQITENSFTKELNYIQLKESSVKLIVSEFNNKLETTIMHKELKRNVTYKYLIRLECYKLIKDILGEKEYNSFKISW